MSECLKLRFTCDYRDETSADPETAKWACESPFSSRADTSAPASNNSWTTSTWPCEHADLRARHNEFLVAICHRPHDVDTSNVWLMSVDRLTITNRHQWHRQCTPVKCHNQRWAINWSSRPRHDRDPQLTRTRYWPYQLRCERDKTLLLLETSPKRYWSTCCTDCSSTITFTFIISWSVNVIINYRLATSNSTHINIPVCYVRI